MSFRAPDPKGKDAAQERRRQLEEWKARRASQGAGRTSLGGEVRLDRLHLGQIEGEDPILGQAEEVVVAQLGERHVVDPHIGCCRPGELGR